MPMLVIESNEMDEVEKYIKIVVWLDSLEDTS